MRHLEELQVDVRQTAGAQLQLYGTECGEQLQGNNGAQSCAYCCHTLSVLQLSQTKAPYSTRIHILIFPAKHKKHIQTVMCWDKYSLRYIMLFEDICHMNNKLSKCPVPDSEAATSLTKLHLLTSHSDIGKCATGPTGGIWTFSWMMLRRDLSAKSLQLRLITYLQGARTLVMLR